MKILFVCALFIEAKSLIEIWELKKIENIRNFQSFGNGEIFLIVTGTGKVSVSVGLTLAFQKLKQENCCVINLGICGSLKDEIGKMFLVNKVSNADTGRDFYPDNLVKTSLPQKSLITLGKLLVLNGEESKNQNDIGDCLIDMEGSAFFETASFFVPVHQIFLLKIVSDNLNQNKLELDKIKKLLKNKTKEVQNFIEFLGNFAKHKKDDSFFDLLKKVHLTVTQKINLQNKLHDIFVQKGGGLDEFLGKIDELIENKKNPKENGKVVYEFICQYWREVY
jgi:nucleoside phosphorylase